jgi:F-box-like
MYTEPPTHLSLADARRALESHRQVHAQITTKIDESEAALQQIVADSKCVINNLESERAALEDKIFQTMAYLSPIRRLPFELLRQIFLFNFDDYPCCAWVLCAVCSLWRKTALSMPQIWSKVPISLSHPMPPT